MHSQLDVCVGSFKRKIICFSSTNLGWAFHEWENIVGLAGVPQDVTSHQGPHIYGRLAKRKLQVAWHP